MRANGPYSHRAIQIEKSDHRHRRLLRPRRERPCRRRAAEQRDELAPLSFDHLVGAGEQRRRHVDAQRLGRLQIDHHLVLGRGLHRQVGRLLALEDAVDIAGCAPVLVDQVRPVGDQAAGGGVLAGASRLWANGAGPPAWRSVRDDGSPARLPSRSGRHWLERAKAVTARSISGASRTSTGLNSTPKDGATVWTAANCPIPDAMAGSRRTATLVTRGAICLSSSSHFPAQAVFEHEETGGVAARPRQARNETGANWSMTIANTIGTVRVACSNGASLRYR